MDIIEVLLQWFINLFDKKSALLIDKSAFLGAVKSKIMSNQELSKELHKLIIIKFEKRKVHSPFKDNISGPELSDMKLISKFSKGIRFLLCVINIFSKYAWVVSLNDKKCSTVTNAFQKILDESNHKPNKIWVDKGSEFCNRSLES